MPLAVCRAGDPQKLRATRSMSCGRPTKIADHPQGTLRTTEIRVRMRSPKHYLLLCSIFKIECKCLTDRCCPISLLTIIAGFFEATKIFFQLFAVIAQFLRVHCSSDAIWVGTKLWGTNLFEKKEFLCFSPGQTWRIAI